ncbi:MAG TPA: hypothetical protein VM681_03475 [Candidatus Thermoplasmatota archaeon]|nr:hypothetical protein [Candidatus Thermoplasmatota archaeon]
MALRTLAVALALVVVISATAAADSVHLPLGAPGKSALPSKATSAQAPPAPSVPLAPAAEEPPTPLASPSPSDLLPPVGALPGPSEGCGLSHVNSPGPCNPLYAHSPSPNPKCNLVHHYSPLSPCSPHYVDPGRVPEVAKAAAILFGVVAEGFECDTVRNRNLVGPPERVPEGAPNPPLPAGWGLHASDPPARVCRDSSRAPPPSPPSAAGGSAEPADDRLASLREVDRAAIAPASVPAQSAPGGAAASSGEPAGVRAAASAPLSASAPLAWWLLLAGAVLAFVPLWALYRRLRSCDLLSQPTRRAVHDFVLANPGTTTGAVARAMAMDHRAAAHHLRLLSEGHYLEAVRIGPRLRYYRNGGSFGREQKRVAVALAHPRSREVLAHLLRHPGAGLAGTSRALGVPKSSAKFHLDKLAALGLLRGGAIAPEALDAVAAALLEGGRPGGTSEAARA